MNCQAIAAKMQEKLDGPLADGDSRQVKEHLKECSACSLLYKSLQRTAFALASLPRRQPSPRFNAAVLAALGRSTASASEPRSATWPIGVAVSLTSFWMAFLAAATAARLSPFTLVRTAQLLSHPGDLAAALKLQTVRAGLLLPEVMSAGRVLDGLLRPEFGAPELPLQLALASGLAGFFLAVVFKTKTSAASWRAR